MRVRPPPAFQAVLSADYVLKHDTYPFAASHGGIASLLSSARLVAVA